jgi:acetoin utilization deacetylase AcuC-like enzyme
MRGSPSFERLCAMQIVYTRQHQRHRTDNVLLEGRPMVVEEVPARADVILSALVAAETGSVAGPTDHGLEPVLGVHDAGFINFLQHAYAGQAATFGEEGAVLAWSFAPRSALRRPRGVLGLKGYYGFGWGTPILAGTWTAAYWSAQCALTAADLVLGGERAAYALCRPPGHHAAADMYGGFCYLNNAAIAARHIQAAVGRVAILDVDYHHGNGTQSIFYADPTVLFCSLHVHPDQDFPFFWGGADERGAGQGAGLNWNWPLPRDTDDARYLGTLDAALAIIRDFKARYLVVSAGFDVVMGDPVGCFAVTTRGLQQIGLRIAALGLRTVIVQEGGYALENLGENAVAFLQPFSGTE